MRSAGGFLVLGLALLLGGCGFTGGGADEDALEVAMTIPPRAAWSPASDDALLLQRLGVTETLVHAGADGGARPGLAESWQRTAPTEWRFTLAAGLRFQSGERVPAQAAADSIERVVHAPAPPRALNGTVERATALDERTLAVRTTGPDPILPQRLGAANAAVLAPAALRPDGSVDPAKGVGTGPFEITAVDGDRSAQLRRYDGHRGGPAKLARVEVRFVPDASARVNGLRSGEFDLIDKVPVAQLGEIRADPALRADAVDLPRTTALHLNTAGGPFADPRLRAAARAAIDRAGLVSGVLQGQGVAASRYFGPAVPWSSQHPPPAPDPAAARRAVTEVGGGAPIPITIGTYPDRPELPALTTVVADELGRAGFAVRIVQEPAGSIEPRILSGELDAAVYSRNQLVDVPDAAAHLASDFSCRGGFGLDHFCAPELDALLAELPAISDPARRAEVFRRADDLLADRIAGIPLVHEQQRFAYRDAVRGVPADPLEREFLTKEVELG
ncbi:MULTISPECIES: ABC transporter substrate-binding protein [unclassified Saccharopolyspora]|uniref:ABC transporter substrate-binding protein n=1 Tax=unclassified Saccharopolyspora TaxID=2646250 RepID=UPI001CD7AD2D|nr:MULTISPECIES: ABC transporter substrate-binding protein [unclassified Saccharopolyspora]MCA1185294.1 ABC transporter substrate-binding protein [Saccharopolyspora sp. 6T]MCA1195075.1 ABC transporter substrate-binding protein [Saccharopolyspora sp. 6V]MCA1281842.1 ABC transporter substrate-binding protein [Saccharopolyspora sp. 7B]